MQQISKAIGLTLALLTATALSSAIQANSFDQASVQYVNVDSSDSSCLGGYHSSEGVCVPDQGPVESCDDAGSHWNGSSCVPDDGYHSGCVEGWHTPYGESDCVPGWN